MASSTFMRKLLATSSLLLVSTSVHAQGAGTAPGAAPSGLEDVVVTARRQAEALLDVPVAVSALSRDTLERARVADLTQAAQLVPNVAITPVNNGASVSVRGVGTSGNDPGLEQSVVINIDGVSVSRAKIVSASQFDMEQLEVLKGPQALFFGKNSPAGVIAITSAGPTQEFSGMARAGYEFEANERYLEGFVSGPLAKDLLFRVAGRYTKMDGWIKNTAKAGPDLAFPGFSSPGPSSKATPQNEAYAMRGILKWSPTTDFSADLRLTYGRLNSDSDSVGELYCSGAQAATGHVSTTSLGLGIVTDPNSDCELNQKVSIGVLPTEFLQNWPAAQKKNGHYWQQEDAWLGSLTLNYDMGDLALTSITGFTKLHGHGYQSIDLTSFAVVVSAPEEKARSWSQEFRLASNYDGPLNFVLGGIFEDARRSNLFESSLGFAGFDADNGNSIYSLRSKWNNRGKTYSGFGQLRWKIVEEVELSGGVRYSREKKNTDGSNLYLNALGAAFGLAPVGQVIRKATSFSNWSPELTLRYKPTDNVMTYVAYKTGYKSGGLATPATISPSYVADPDLLAFAPETSKGVEAGFRGEFAGRTVRVDVTAFRYTFSDLQLSTFNPTLVAYFIANAGKARTTGVEGSVAWRATPELSLNASASYTDAKFLEFTEAQCYATIQGTSRCPLGAAGSYNRSGQPLPRSPKYTFMAGFDYERTIDAGLKIGLGGNATYNSSSWTSELGDPVGIVSPFWRFDASVRVGAADDKWQIALLGRNLSNAYHPLVTSDAVLAPPGNHFAYVLRPRQIALQGTVRF